MLIWSRLGHRTILGRLCHRREAAPWPAGWDASAGRSLPRMRRSSQFRLSAVSAVVGEEHPVVRAFELEKIAHLVQAGAHAEADAVVQRDRVRIRIRLSSRSLT